MKDWLYDEFAQVGVDYTTGDAADTYDDQMDFRDYQEEARSFIEKLGVETAGMTAIDMGCGTGAFSISAARYFDKMLAVDVSERMLAIAKGKAEADGIDNISFHHSGFLNFQPDKPADVINTKWVVHHLPDFWKQAALLNMNKMLKPGGVLFMTDFVFQFSPDYEHNVQTMVDAMAKDFDEQFVDEVKQHIREEFSTFDWILSGMIERAGFEIEHADTDNELAMEYLCRKVRSFD